MDTHSGKITSVRKIVRKTCWYCQKHPEKNSTEGFTGANRTPHDPERNRSHSQQQTPNIRGKRHNTYITNSIEVVTSHQKTNPVNINPPWRNRRQHHREHPRTHAANQRLLYLTQQQRSIWNR